MYPVMCGNGRDRVYDYIYRYSNITYTYVHNTNIHMHHDLQKPVTYHHAKLESSIMSYKLHKFATMVYMS